MTEPTEPEGTKRTRGKNRPKPPSIELELERLKTSRDSAVRLLKRLPQSAPGSETTAVQFAVAAAIEELETK